MPYSRAVDGWHWTAAAVEALLLLVLVLLRYDTCGNRMDVTIRAATGSALPSPVYRAPGFRAVLLVPLWFGLILIAVPAVAVGGWRWRADRRD